MDLDAPNNSLTNPAQPLRVPYQHFPAPTPPTSPPPSYLKAPSKPLHLPPEIISQILTHLSPSSPDTQATLHACTLLSRTWYTTSIALLYNHPHLTPNNFHHFTTTICPSKNASIKFSPLATLVTVLDLGALVSNTSKSLTARLLGRLKPNIETFVAPQSSFAINSFAALAKCVRLRVLDLRLISASISTRDLFHTLSSLHNLEILFFPRCSILPSPPHLSKSLPNSTSTSSISATKTEKTFTWPPKLRALHLAGGITDTFLSSHLTHIPPSLNTLSIQHCSQIHALPLLSVLETIGPQLHNLTIRHPMNRLGIAVLDPLLNLCSSLIELRISADYISNGLFTSLIIPSLTLSSHQKQEQDQKDVKEKTTHPLRILHLDCSTQAAAEVGIDPEVISAAIDEERLADLRSVGVSARLAWGASVGSRREVGGLVARLEMGEERESWGRECGVGVFNVRD